MLKEKLYAHNTDESIIDLINEIIPRIKGAKNPALVCIGTEKVAFDAFGPMLYGSFIELGVKRDNLYWFNATNAEEVISKVKSNNHDVTIAFDAELIYENNKFELMKLRFKDTPIHPGAGAGKTISPIGDACIMLPTGYIGDFRKVLIKTKNWELYNLNDIYRIAYKFARIFVESVSSVYNFLD